MTKRALAPEREKSGVQKKRPGGGSRSPRGKTGVKAFIPNDFSDVSRNQTPVFHAVVPKGLVCKTRC